MSHLSRRSVLKSGLTALMAGMASESRPAWAASPSPLERAKQFPLRPKTRERILAGHRAILDELKPTPSQLDRGLSLHYNSFVADMQGNISGQTGARQAPVGRADVDAIA